MALALGGDSNAAARRLFEIHGIGPDRLVLVDRQPRRKYLELTSQIDIALDPFPFAGMTTTCDMLWMGVPVVTLAGGTFASRVGVSLLTAVGLGDLVAQSAADCVRIVTDLARDVPRLQNLRSSLRHRMEQSPLRDEAGLARNIEGAYRQMWHRWCEQRR
jgi:predicted O-linked N-acetylglucosamine transferase (SPINDLY family)